MSYRNLGKLQYIVNEATGLNISYCDDDFVLPEQNDFLLQYDDLDEDSFHCYFHENCTFSAQKSILNSLEMVCADNGCTLIPEGNFVIDSHGAKLEVYIL